MTVLRVARVVAETADAVSIHFQPPADAVEKYRYRPGQFLTLRVPSDHTGSVARSYSLSSAPHDDGPLTVTVKRVAAGYGSNWLCDNACEGMELEALAPGGTFVPASLDTDLLLFAAGSGVTPMMSILKSVLARGSGNVTLIYANRDEKSVIFARELTELSVAHADRLTILQWLESVQGLPTEPQLRALAAPWAGREVFICGPGPFMAAAQTAMGALGADPTRVHVEKFVSMSANPFDTEPVAEDGDTSAVEVELDGSTVELAWPRKRVLLDLLLEHGMDAPYSCREGACSACTCRVVDGEVKMLRNDVLEPDDLADGYVLACQAVPVSDRVRVSYE